MSESFVDITYRGVPLGRRIKLVQVRPNTGYLEVPAPMPVGTSIVIATDEGVQLQARVVGIHEQVGGSEHAPGMLVKPAFDDDKASQWWRTRVTLPELELPKAAEKKSGMTVRPRSHTTPQPVQEPPAPAPAPQPPTEGPKIVVEMPIETEAQRMERAVTVPDVPQMGDEGDTKRTTVMDAVDQELLAQLTRGRDTKDDVAPGTSGEYPVIDDGLRTTHMNAVDVSALGLGIEVTASGSMKAVSDADADDAEDEDNGNGDSAPQDPHQTTPGIGDTKSKKRKKKKR